MDEMCAYNNKFLILEKVYNYLISLQLYSDFQLNTAGFFICINNEVRIVQLSYARNLHSMDKDKADEEEDDKDCKDDDNDNDDEEEGEDGWGGRR